MGAGQSITLQNEKFLTIRGDSCIFNRLKGTNRVFETFIWEISDPITDEKWKNEETLLLGRVRRHAGDICRRFGKGRSLSCRASSLLRSLTPLTMAEVTNTSSMSISQPQPQIPFISG